MQSVRKKRRSKYDVATLYKGSTTRPYFMIQPGDTSFYKKPEETKSLDTNDPSLNLRPQKDRTVFTYEQMFILERAFQIDKHPNHRVRESVAQLAGLDFERVRIWYQNRRAKEKRDDEDKLAMLAEKFNTDPTLAYTTQPYSSRLVMKQKISELNQIFDERKRHARRSSDDRSSKFHSRQSSKYHPYNTQSSSGSRERHQQHKQPRQSTLTENNEFEYVKNLLRSTYHEQPKHSTPKLPSINSLNQHLQQTEHVHMNQENHHRKQPRSSSSRRRSAERIEDDETRYIRDLMKSDFIKKNAIENVDDVGSSKKRKINNNTTKPNYGVAMQVKQEEDTTSQKYQSLLHTNSTMGSTNRIDWNHNSETPQQNVQRNFLQQSLSPEQLNVDQLLNQRSYLEQLQRLLYSSIQSGHDYSAETQGKYNNSNFVQSYQNLVDPPTYSSQRDMPSPNFPTQSTQPLQRNNVLQRVYQEIEFSNN